MLPRRPGDAAESELTRSDELREWVCIELVLRAENLDAYRSTFIR